MQMSGPLANAGGVGSWRFPSLSEVQRYGNCRRGTWPPDKCERRGQYRKATLLERYGADANMVELRLTLAAGCPKIEANKIMDLCGVYYPDRIGK